MTEEEYKAAMRSTITAYYTEPELIRYMYRALERFGFEGGPDRRILDPGMGTGNFYSVLPEQYQGSKLYGVELDSITGRIAKQLYPEADISVMGYEAVKFEDNSFDVILGNIPFNSVKIYDRRYNELNPYIHDYFFIKSLDLAKPGGIIRLYHQQGHPGPEGREPAGVYRTAGRVHRRHPPAQYGVQNAGGNRSDCGYCLFEKAGGPHAA